MGPDDGDDDDDDDVDQDGDEDDDADCCWQCRGAQLAPRSAACGACGSGIDGADTKSSSSVLPAGESDWRRGGLKQRQRGRVRSGRVVVAGGTWLLTD